MINFERGDPWFFILYISEVDEMLELQVSWLVH